MKGQLCDLDRNNNLYGQCRHYLACGLDEEVLVDGEIPKPQCIYVTQENTGGPKGKPYENVCQIKEIKLSAEHQY